MGRQSIDDAPAIRSSIVSMYSNNSQVQKNIKSPGEMYVEAKTPNTDELHKEAKTPDIEGGALRAGGAPKLLTRECFGLIVNNVAVGWVDAMISRTNYPFFNNYLRMDGYQITAAFVLINMPFSLKTFMAIFSDSFPIRGYRRIPYMNIGWGMCGLALLITALIPMGDPHYVPGTETVLNPDSADSAYRYVILFFLAKFGLVTAIVADDGMMVEFAQREPEERRGSTQTYVYFMRMLSGAIGFVLTGLVFNGREYGGTYDWSLTLNAVMAISCCCCFITIPFANYMLIDTPVERQSFTKHCRQMWEVTKQRAVWQVMAFFFVSGLFGGFGCSPGGIVQREWARVQPFNESICAVVGSLLFSFSLLIARKYLINANWRIVLLTTSLFCLFVDCIPTFFTIYDVFRHEWFWLGVPIIERIPSGINFIVASYIVVEVAEEGCESGTYSMITTVKDLTGPFTSSISKNVDAMFDAFEDDIKSDTPYVRNQVAYCYIIMYVMHLIGNVFLIMLPKQKKDAQALRRRGGKSTAAAVIALSLFIFALLWSIGTNILSIFPSTKCLKIAGGPGCD